MFDFHGDKTTYFQYQYLTARDYIIPFIEHFRSMDTIHTVMEIGCGEAGVLKAFLEKGCRCLGIELSAARVATAKEMHHEAFTAGKIAFITEDIYNIDPASGQVFKCDLIILKDVIEHIPDQEKFIPFLKGFLNPGGVIFFGFPPWQMPFGGHQQICQSRLLSKWPYLHLLPRKLYLGLLRKMREPEHTQRELMEIRDTRISIERFERIVKQSRMQILKRTFWLLNPIYKFKFGKGPWHQIRLISAIPYFRNFLTTAAYYLIGS